MNLTESKKPTRRQIEVYSRQMVIFRGPAPLFVHNLQAGGGLGSQLWASSYALSAVLAAMDRRFLPLPSCEGGSLGFNSKEKLAGHFRLHHLDEDCICRDCGEKASSGNLTCELTDIVRCLSELQTSPALAARDLSQFTWQGKRVCELGAGTGLPGNLLARLGAHVLQTDQAEAMDILAVNAGVNGIHTLGAGGGDTARGTLVLEELSWGGQSEHHARLVRDHPLLTL
jgi:hypothetical protein